FEHVHDLNFVNANTVIPPAPRRQFKRRSLIIRLLVFLFLNFPKAIGRVIPDLVGTKENVPDSTYLILGYGIIVILVLIALGIVHWDSVVSIMKLIFGSSTK